MWSFHSALLPATNNSFPSLKIPLLGPLLINISNLALGPFLPLSTKHSRLILYPPKRSENFLAIEAIFKPYSACICKSKRKIRDALRILHLGTLFIIFSVKKPTISSFSAIFYLAQRFSGQILPFCEKFCNRIFNWNITYTDSGGEKGATRKKTASAE